MSLQVVVYDNDGMVRNLDGIFNRVQNLTFKSGLPGGFLDCSFTVPSIDELPDWLNECDSVQVYHGNKVVWDGSIEDTIRIVGPKGGAIRFRCLGWWFNCKQRLYTGTHTIDSGDEIIKDAIKNCPLLSHNYDDIETNGQNLGSLDWTNEYVSQVIADVLELGDDQTPPRVWHFGVWERTNYDFDNTGSTTDQVSASTDDAYDYTGVYNESADFVYFGDISGNRVTAGFRFPTVAIPQGETISAAKLQVYEYVEHVAIAVEIYGEDSDDAAVFNTADRPSGRTKTTASVAWDATLTTGDWTDSPDITDVVQEIVDRPGWVSGNDMAIIVYSDASSNAQRVYSWDEGTSKGCKLVVSYGETYDEYLARPEYFPEDRDDWDYEIYARELDGDAHLTRTADGLVNQVIAKYDSSYTAAGTDSDSQDAYHRRDYILDVGGASSTVAAIARDMWVDSHKDIQRRAGSITVRGYVRKRWSGAPVHVSHVRAGERIRVLDLDHGDAVTYYIAQTQYTDAADPQQAMLAITPEDVPDRMSMLVAKL